MNKLMLSHKIFFCFILLARFEIRIFFLFMIALYLSFLLYMKKMIRQIFAKPSNRSLIELLNNLSISKIRIKFVIFNLFETQFTGMHLRLAAFIYFIFFVKRNSNKNHALSNSTCILGSTFI